MQDNTRSSLCSIDSGFLPQCALTPGDLEEGMSEESNPNCSSAVVERLRVRRLAWGDAGHQASLQKEFGHFGLILGADVVYVDEAVPLLMASLAGLLRQDTQVKSWAEIAMMSRT